MHHGLAMVGSDHRFNEAGFKPHPNELKAGIKPARVQLGINGKGVGCD